MYGAAYVSVDIITLDPSDFCTQSLCLSLHYYNLILMERLLTADKAKVKKILMHVRS